MPMASATSRKVSGFIADTPRSKKPCCRLTISDTTLTIVRARWSSALTSQLALARHSLSQARHRRVIAVDRPRLERETFGQRASADAGGIEPLHHLERLLDEAERLSGHFGDLGQWNGQIAGLVETFGDDPREAADVAREAV